MKKFGEDQLIRFCDIQQKLSEEGEFPPFPVQIAVNNPPLYYFNVKFSLKHRALCYVFSFIPKGQ